MKIGFTGTQRGMTDTQRTRVAELLKRASEFHHGDCVGADAQAHELALALKIPIVIHPPENPNKRAWCQGGLVLPPKPYLERNQDIVDQTEILIATPFEAETLRSGTWATVRYARRRGIPIWIVGHVIEV